jgi:hypothetical protein
VFVELNVKNHPRPIPIPNVPTTLWHLSHSDWDTVTFIPLQLRHFHICSQLVLRHCHIFQLTATVTLSHSSNSNWDTLISAPTPTETLLYLYWDNDTFVHPAPKHCHILRHSYLPQLLLRPYYISIETLSHLSIQLWLRHCQIHPTPTETLSYLPQLLLRHCHIYPSSSDWDTVTFIQLQLRHSHICPNSYWDTVISLLRHCHIYPSSSDWDTVTFVQLQLRHSHWDTVISLLRHCYICLSSSDWNTITFMQLWLTLSYPSQTPTETRTHLSVQLRNCHILRHCHICPKSYWDTIISLLRNCHICPSSSDWNTITFWDTVISAPTPSETLLYLYWDTVTFVRLAPTETLSTIISAPTPSETRLYLYWDTVTFVRLAPTETLSHSETLSYLPQLLVRHCYISIETLSHLSV